MCEQPAKNNGMVTFVAFVVAMTIFYGLIFMFFTTMGEQGCSYEQVEKADAYSKSRAEEWLKASKEVDQR